jgi:hypothetical protein
VTGATVTFSGTGVTAGSATVAGDGLSLTVPVGAGHGDLECCDRHPQRDGHQL